MLANKTVPQAYTTLNANKNYGCCAARAELIAYRGVGLWLTRTWLLAEVVRVLSIMMLESRTQ